MRHGCLAGAPGEVSESSDDRKEESTVVWRLLLRASFGSSRAELVLTQRRCSVSKVLAWTFLIGVDDLPSAGLFCT